MAAHQQTDKPIEDEKTERVAKKKEKIGSTECHLFVPVPGARYLGHVVVRGTEF